MLAVPSGCAVRAMPRGAGVFSPNGELRAANLVQVEDLFVKAAGSDQRGFQRIPGDAATFSQPGGKRVHLQQSSEVGAALGIGAEPQMQHRRRSGADGRSPGAPLFWKGERLECAPGGHEIVDRMHHQRIGADVCQYNSDSAVRQVRSSELRGFEASGGPPSNVEKLKARYDRRLLERQRVWRDYGHDLAAQVSRNSGRREGAWLAWLEQQQQATAAHNVSATGNDAPSEAGEAEDDPEDEDELHRMMRLGHGDLPYRANVGCGGRPGDKHQAAPIQWPQSFDPSGIGPISSDPKDYAVDLENGWNDGFAALSDGISEVESILGELWNEIGAAEGTSGDQHELGLPPASQAPTRAEERANTSESTTVQPEPAEAPTSRQQSQLRHDEPPRGRWAVVSEGKAVRDAMLLRDRGGTHVAIGEGAVTPGGQREALEDRLMSSQHQIERFTNAALGDSESEGWRRGARAAPVVRSETADGLGFLVPPPEELCAEAADAPSSTTEAQRQRREAAALYLVKARGRMFESPSNAQRTYHEGAHVATSMGIPGAGIMACFEKDKAVHERDPPKQRCVFTRVHLRSNANACCTAPILCVKVSTTPCFMRQAIKVRYHRSGYGEQWPRCSTASLAASAQQRQPQCV